MSEAQARAQIRAQDVLYLQPDRILKELPTTSRPGRNLNALLKISRVVHSIADLGPLQEQILELIFEVVPAERAAILLDGTSSEKFSSVFAHTGAAKRGEPVRVSRTITRQVMEQGVAILGADVPGSGGLRGVENLVTFQLRPLLCVPLTVFQRVIAVFIWTPPIRTPVSTKTMWSWWPASQASPPWPWRMRAACSGWNRKTCGWRRKSICSTTWSAKAAG